MMATNNHFCAWILCWFILHASLAQSTLSSRLGPLEGLSRVKRQDCQDGTYKHEGRDCCQCAIGQRLEKHCVSDPNDTECVHCKPGSTYNSHPNSRETCLPCASCTHPIAHLEVDEPCTIARNTKCRCQKDYYCDPKGPCTSCDPCTLCESTGIKEACTPTSDTVCNETAANSTGGIIAGVLIALAVIAAGVGVFFWRKRSAGKRQQEQAQQNGVSSSEADVEMQPLKELKVDIMPHLPDIAEELGWKDMELLAIRSKITAAAIESCQLDHRGDSQAQTLQLLRKWAEKHGRNAPNELIRMLQDSGKKAKAERIYDILSNNPAA